MRGDDELNVREVRLQPAADALLPGNVQMGVDLVDDDDPGIRNVRCAVRRVQDEFTVGVVDLLEDVHDQGRHRAVAVTHLPQREPVVAVDDPQTLGVDVVDLVVVGQQVVTQDGQGSRFHVPCTVPVLERAQVLLDEPAHAFRQRCVLVEETRQPGDRA